MVNSVNLGVTMNQLQLIKEIQSLREYLYIIGKDTSNYSNGEILKVSQELDQKLIIYQKLMVMDGNNSMGNGLNNEEVNKNNSSETA